MPARRLALTVLLLLVGTALVVVSGARSVLAQDAPPAAPPGCVEPKPCVYVSPDPRVGPEVGTVYTFAGQGWRRGRVRVTFGEFCPPDSTCDVGSTTKTIATDGRGRFTFRLRYDGGPVAMMRRGPSGDPQGVDFEQRRGRRTVRRDAFPPPPPSTPAQRTEAQAVVRVVARAHRALERREEAAFRASDETFRAVKRCLPGGGSAYATEARGAVIDALFALALDRGTYAVVDTELRAFGRELAALGLTDPELATAAGAWSAAVEAPRPWTVERACAEHRRWRRAGYPADRRPVDPERLSELQFESVVLLSEPIAAGGARLRALRGGRVPSERFGGGLLERGELEGFFG